MVHIPIFKRLLIRISNTGIPVWLFSFLKKSKHPPEIYDLHFQSERIQHFTTAKFIELEIVAQSCFLLSIRLCGPINCIHMVLSPYLDPTSNTSKSEKLFNRKYFTTNPYHKCTFKRQTTGLMSKPDLNVHKYCLSRSNRQ